MDMQVESIPLPKDTVMYYHFYTIAVMLVLL